VHVQPDVWITLYVRDLAASIAFYASLPGFEETYRLPPTGRPERAGFRCGGTEFILAERDTTGEAGDGQDFRPDITIPTADIEVDYNRLLEQGARPLRSPVDLGNGDRSAWVADPDGAPVQLLQSDQGRGPAWRPVASTAIDEISWGDRSSVLIIRFQNGRVYRYFDVPKDVYDAFLTADSKGHFFNKRIRDHYAYRQVTD
jgi:catechol 2,3-dioxygenase-like lactoylglutathione lyase family enzyme